MTKDERVIPSGPFKGKRIELAPTDRIDVLQSLAEDFMEAIFEMEPGSYLITDESSIRDFRGVEDMDRRDMHEKIRSVFDVDVTDIESGNLVEILTRIHQQRPGPARRGGRTKASTRRAGKTRAGDA